MDGKQSAAGGKMAGLIRANIGGIDQIRTSLAENLEALRKEEKELQEAVAKLGMMWEGEAHTVFQADMAENCRQIVEIDQEIAGILGLEEKAVSEYSGAETEIRSKIESL
jgi:uncharacterized protein YukE